MISSRGCIGVVLAAAALLVPASEAGAALPGELDVTFGGGRVVPPFEPESRAGGVAVQPDGKVLVTGSSEASPGFAIARLLPNGSPDPSWGGDGLVTTSLGESAACFDVAVQPDGKVVAVGEAPGAENEDFAIVRYLETGGLDPSFGEGGIVILPVGTLGDEARAVAIGPGGRIAVTGTAELPGSVLGAGTAVLEADGTPEAAFAEDGTTVITTESESNDRGEGIAVQPDGKVLVADSTGGGIGDGFTIVRLGLDGKPDSSWGGDGVVETPIPGEGEIAYGRVSDVVVQPDGKIVGGGYGADFGGTPPEYTAKFALARYTPEGELDQSFGTGGIFSMSLSEGGDFGQALGIDAKGRLTLGGTYDPNPQPLEEHYAPAMVRLAPNGTLDPSFGAGGIVLGPLGAGVEDEDLKGLAIQPDGKIITAGTEYFGVEPFYVPVVSRYIADIEAPAEPPPKPKVDAPPDTNMKKVPRKVAPADLTRLRGTASDPDGEAVRKVQVALVRVRPGRKRAKPKHWRTARGTSRWAYKLPHPLSPGRYVVFSRAIDEQGLAESEFSRPDRNRYAFRVLTGAGKG